MTYRLDVYGENSRCVVYMDTEEFGKVAIVLIGAMMVGSIILTAKVGDKLARTDELGYFAFGGSTIVVLWQKDALTFDQDLLENSEKYLETLVCVDHGRKRLLFQELEAFYSGPCRKSYRPSEQLGITTITITTTTTNITGESSNSRFVI